MLAKCHADGTAAFEQNVLGQGTGRLPCTEFIDSELE